MWANEQETPAILDMPTEEFRKRLPALEADGLPKKAALNGKRFIPSIERFAALQAEIPQKVDTGNHPEFHTRIQDLPEEVQNRLCTCFGTSEEIAAKQKCAHLVCHFGAMKGKATVQYLYGADPIRAAVLREDGKSWEEVAISEFNVTASKLSHAAFHSKLGAGLPQLSDWLFCRPERRWRHR